MCPFVCGDRGATYNQLSPDLTTALGADDMLRNSMFVDSGLALEAEVETFTKKKVNV